MPTNIKECVPLSNFTSFGIGGPARYFAIVKTTKELEELALWAKEKTLPVFVLGGGSNVLISDNGFDGLVILMGIKGLNYKKESKNSFLVEVGAGELWDGFVKEVTERGLAGVECLSGVPGKVGGAVVGNIGAYGQEVCETLLEATVYDISTQSYKVFSKEECDFKYRASCFKGCKDKIVVKVSFMLNAGVLPSLKHKELQEAFNDVKPTLTQVREAVIKLRAAKSMILDDNDPNSKGAGCFFKNPIVSQASFDNLANKFPNVPNWPEQTGMVKISAGWLVEKAGFPKGYVYKEGKVGLSQKHALAIINLGQASSNDVVEFSSHIQRAVLDTFGIKLEPEVVFLGFND